MRSRAFWQGFLDGFALPGGWALAWSLYWAGDLASRFDDWPGGYRIYQWLMRQSATVQDRFGLSGPWSPPHSVPEKDDGR